MSRLLTTTGLGAGALWLGYAWVPHLLTPFCIWRGPGSFRRLALTFDDGPDPIWTPRILALLGALDVDATFFLIGERAARHPDVVRAITDGGHEIGNHSWSHRSLWLCDPARTREQIVRAHETLAALAGREPRYFRPAWGMVNAAMFGALRRVGTRCVFWSIQTEGLRPRPGSRQARTLLTRAHPGAIVDLHDAEGVPGAPARLLDALPIMIDGLRERGYGFATLSGLLEEGAA